MYLVFKCDSVEAWIPGDTPVVVTFAVPLTTILELPVCLKVKLAPCWYAIPLSITSTAVIIPLADLASALITALSPIGLVFESSYMLSIVPPAPEVAPDIEPLSLNPKPVSYTHLTLPTIYSV